jgi:hypothetical protein
MLGDLKWREDGFEETWDKGFEYVGGPDWRRAQGGGKGLKMQEDAGRTFEDADAEVGYGSLRGDEEGYSEGDVGDIRGGETSGMYR